MTLLERYFCAVPTIAGMQLAPRKRELSGVASQACGPDKDRYGGFAIAIFEDHHGHGRRDKRLGRSDALERIELRRDRIAQACQLRGRLLCVS